MKVKILVDRLRHLLYKLKEPWLHSGQWSRKSYSQEGEDLILDNLMGGVGYGFYVEVGAHHPFRFSNTFLFYHRGWRGICIDPLPGTKALFKKWRPRDVAIEMGVSAQSSILTYYMFNEPAFNTFDPALAKERDGVQQFRLVGQQEVRTEPLRKILDDHLPSGQQIDILSVDVEGLDLQVLTSNDWSMHRPKHIVTECLEADPSLLGQDPVVVFLSGVGYRVFAVTGYSVIFTQR